MIQTIDTGDHTMFLADVLEIQYDAGNNPLLYGQRKYWHRGDPIDKPPLLYVTCTVRPNQLRMDGRLQGIEKHPQSIELKLTRAGEEVLNETSETDQYGYFELIRKADLAPSHGTYLAEAKWKNLTGKATIVY